MKKLLSVLISVLVIFVACAGISAIAYADEEQEICIHEAEPVDVVVKPATVDADGVIESRCPDCEECFGTTIIPQIKAISLSATAFTYSGKVITPSFIIKDSNGDAVSKEFYTVSYSSGRTNVGKYTAKVTFRGNYSGTKSIAFTIAPKVSVSYSTIAIKQVVTVKASGSKKAYSFKSSNKSIATVDSKGVVTGKKAGTVTITVTSNGVSKTQKIVVKKPSLALSKASATFAKGTTYTVKATPMPTNAKVTWTTSNKSVATVSAGKIKGVKAGAATITARISFKGVTYKKTCKVTITNPKINRTTATVYNGKTIKLSVTGNKGKIAWSTSDKNIAYVSASGTVKGVKKGTCTIYAKVDGKTLSCKVTVPSKYASTPVVDMGAYFGVQPIATTKEDGVMFVLYDMYDLDKKNVNWVDKYIASLSGFGFSYVETVTEDDIDNVFFSDGKWLVDLTFDYYDDLIAVGYVRL